MNKFLKELEKEMAKVSFNYKYYETQTTKEQFIQLEERQIKRLIKLVKLLGGKTVHPLKPI